MREDSHPPAATGADTSETSTSPALPRWKKFLLGLALGVGVLGALLYGVALLGGGGPAAPEPSAQATAPGLQPHSLRAQSLGGPPYTAIGESADAGQAAGDALRMVDWSGFFMKLGFSFVVGFSIGFAAAGFLRLTLFVFGVILLLLFGLQYAGLVQVNWGGMEGIYNAFITWLQPHIGSFKDFITSNLSSSGMAAAGLFVGFKK